MIVRKVIAKRTPIPLTAQKRRTFIKRLKDKKYKFNGAMFVKIQGIALYILRSIFNIFVTTYFSIEQAD